MKNSKEEKIKIKENKKNEEITKNRKLKNEAIEAIKPIFIKYNAISKDKAILKEEIIAEIEENNNTKKYLKFLKLLKIVKKEHGKYYYEESNETKEIKNTNTRKILLGLIGLLIVLIIVYIIISNKAIKVTLVENDEVSFKIPTNWSVLYEYEKEYGWSYYKYISNAKEAEQNNQIEVQNSGDYSNYQYPANISVYYSKSEITEANELKDKMETYISEEIKPEEHSINILKSKKGYDMVELKIKNTTSDQPEVEYIYYIINGDQTAYITGYSSNLDDEEILSTDIKIIANSFEWK